MTRGTRVPRRRGASAGALTGLLLITGAVDATPAVAAPPAHCHGHLATIVGTPGDDVLTGTAGADVVVGLGGSDTVTGLGGDDLLCGGRGADTVDGGTGSHDVLVGGPGDDHLAGASDVSVLRGGPGDDVETSSSPAQARFTAEPGDDAFTTTTATVAVFDLSGSPVGVLLRPGRGVLRSTRGQTALDLAPGTTARVHGSARGDILSGTTGNDVIDGGPGNDRITGLNGDDRIFGGTGKNFVFGEAGDDVLAENHHRGIGRNAVWAGRGDDILRFASNDDLFGGTGDDHISMVMSARFSIGVEDAHGDNTVSLRLRHRPQGGPWSHAELDLGRRFQAQLLLPGRRPFTFYAHVHLLRLDVAHARSWRVDGTPQADEIIARSGSRGVPLVVNGQAGNDLLVTGRGDDTLNGGPGHDRGYAGAGNDTCVSIAAPAPGHSTTGCRTPPG
jgi:Ca2+-binding RTX toxin-like protein